MNDVMTRWNTTLYMLMRVNEQFPLLMALANDFSLAKQAAQPSKIALYISEVQTVIENLASLLVPFDKLPQYSMLKKHLQCSANHYQTVEN